MFGRLFDSPWHILVLVLVIVVVFGANKLPGAARSLGRSLRIFKSEVRQMNEDDTPRARRDDDDDDDELPLEGRIVDEGRQKGDRSRRAN